MNRKLKGLFAALLILVLVFQSIAPKVYAKEITGNATVYIKSAAGDSYLYADGADVKCGAFQEKNPYYIWNLTQKDDGTYWIQNMGTSTYMCLENANGTVRLESTIYDVWQSCKWYITGNANSSTINNLWKSATTGGYMYTNGGSTVYYGTTAQQWVFEDYSISSDVTDDGYSGRLVNSVAADAIAIPEPNTDVTSIGAVMPYVRYDSEKAVLGGGASLVKSDDWSLTNVASQASNQSYVTLPGSGAYAEWTMNSYGNGVVMRFTLPDSGDGLGLTGSLDIYVNDVKVRTVDLTSYYMWQYLNGGASDTPGSGTACFAFDEVHFRLDKSLQPGDKIKVQSTGANGLVYGVDFLEIEETGDAIPQPAGSYSVTDFGAVPDDGIDDYAAISACIAAANSANKDVYIPAGTYHIGQMWKVAAQNMMITGAGMWYTNIQFTSSEVGGGGVSGVGEGNSYNLEFCNMYLNSNLRSRYSEGAIYKAFMDVFDGRSLIHDVWEEHFECGFWIADYNGSLDYSDGITIANCRIRNNFADGVNFCQGTSNATVYNCSIRNNGDDGLAMWNNNYMAAKDLSNNKFCYNTIDFVWRAGGIAVYGGNGHQIYNNYIRDCFMASGIHLNTNFSGYQFDNTQNITFSNNIIIRSGCSYDTWQSEYGAVDVIGNTKNVTFNNTYIYDAQHDGIRVGGAISNILFKNLHIYGTGRDGLTPSYSSLPHLGAAIMCFGGNPSVNIEGLELCNIGYADTYYLNGANVNIQDVTTVSSYTVPSYPAIGSLQTDHRDDPIPPPTTEEESTEESIEESTEESIEESTEESAEESTEESSVEIYGNPDMIVTDIQWSPANPAAGDKIIFSATIKNQGTGVADAGMINGIQWQINGTCVSWDDTNSTQIMPGESVTVTASGGPNKVAYWDAAEGTYAVMAWVNDVLRYPESNTNNNQYTEYITVTAETEASKEESVESSSESTEESTETVVKPSKVTGVQAVYEDGKIKVTWDDNGAAQYRVMRFTSENGYETMTYKATAEGYIDTDLIEAQRYFYRVCGYFYNADGQLVQGSVSDSAGVVATDKAPGKVAEVTASISNGNVTLDWDAPEGVRYYKIARAPGWATTDGSYTCIKYNVIDTAYTDTDVASGKWRYKVVGYYKAVDGSWVYGTMSPTLFVTVE